MECSRGATGRLEPGGGAIASIFVAETRFEDPSFGTGAGDLENEDGHEKKEKKRTLEEEKEPRGNECAKKIDGIANARIEAAGDELSGLGRHEKGIAKLDARDGQEDDRGNQERQSCDAKRCPRRMGEFVDEEGDPHKRQDRDHERAAFH